MIKGVCLFKSWQCGCPGCHAFGDFGMRFVAFVYETCGVYVSMMAFVIICTHITMVGFLVSAMRLLTEVLQYYSMIFMFGIMCQLGIISYVMLNEYNL
jgi:cadmium resistance protein CadD (predicted permease)